MDSTASAVDKYYRKLESRLGYKILLGDAKHFGYYPSKAAGISERKALELQQDVIAQALGLSAEQIILDAGCGRGVTACYLAEQYNVQVVGIDLLDFEIEIAKRRARAKGLDSKVSFVTGNFANLERLEKRFDAIYTSETLSHAPDVREVLEQFFKVLKPGGQLALMEYTLAPDTQFKKHELLSLDQVIKGSAMAGLKQFRHDEFPALLESTGFTGVTQKILTEYIRPSFERLYAKSKWPYRFAKALGISERLINTATPTLLRPLLDKGLIRYCLFTASRPF